MCLEQIGPDPARALRAPITGDELAARQRKAGAQTSMVRRLTTVELLRLAAEDLRGKGLAVTKAAVARASGRSVETVRRQWQAAFPAVNNSRDADNNVDAIPGLFTPSNGVPYMFKSSNPVFGELGQVPASAHSQPKTTTGTATAPTDEPAASTTGEPTLCGPINTTPEKAASEAACAPSNSFAVGVSCRYGHEETEAESDPEADTAQEAFRNHIDPLAVGVSVLNGPAELLDLKLGTSELPAAVAELTEDRQDAFEAGVDQALAECLRDAAEPFAVVGSSVTAELPAVAELPCAVVDPVPAADPLRQASAASTGGALIPSGPAVNQAPWAGYASAITQRGNAGCRLSQAVGLPRRWSGARSSVSREPEG